MALIAARRCGVVPARASAAARASTASAVTCSGPAVAGGIREHLLPHAGGGPAQAIGHQRQRMRLAATRHPGAFQQFRDRGNALQQILLGFRCHSRLSFNHAFARLSMIFGRDVMIHRRWFTASSAQKKRPVTDAKEVGVGNPAGRNVLSPD